MIAEPPVVGADATSLCGEIHVWVIHLEMAEAPGPGIWDVLSPSERDRAASYRFVRDRERFVKRRLTLRRLLASYVDIDPVALDIRGGRHDRPSLAAGAYGVDVRFSVSSSGGLAMYAFAAGRDVGVDIEQIRHDVAFDDLVRRLFSKGEQEALAACHADDFVDRFFACWTLNEAFVKATGDGLARSLDTFDVDPSPGCAPALVATRPDPTEAERWHVQRLSAVEGYSAALACESADLPVKIRQLAVRG